MHLNKFLDVLKNELPEICADKDLVEYLPNFFKNPTAITRLRSQGRCPPYFHVPPHIVYLRDDILGWLREIYKQAAPVKPTAQQKRSSKRNINKRTGSRRCKGA